MTTVLLIYSNSPSQAGSATATWPDASQIQLDQGRPTLAMFIHPHCPCSRASISELALPGVTVETDKDGNEARLFGAETSGDVRLYGVNGRLMFRGGITIARGHSGLFNCKRAMEDQ